MSGKTLVKNWVKKYKNNKLLLLGIIFTLPSIYFWISAVLSYTWVNIIGKYILSLPPKYQFLTFLGLPLLGLITSLISYFKSALKPARYLIIVNFVFLILIIFASFRLTG
ncbi:hypothetical protein A3A76_05345 [Candidatus Woesebacteria bacterium RIFCSPLOWO2_01_FULL_39_23]|uniref:Uncharacterized protein n=1 Tax=Candidatus Woesebacteria bacterium RIFCSPHIGHO2_01_FULL_40_22 TaxID=1802499 RepID=A0A1F7YKQ0_9BACT|nr:MAG: hypothetical protein A2141_04570 [Candidatus Woesebacteria bacterium RBG_16_40_11]OGM27857.1 MAG: hypothetical protein A2628_05565 [Candidatus Woesebacteria bacterium RIFCSPHIGHO2_01_FULL_40_22]OGM36319.1 MAG: hypothetical protein A3E41_02760 [Candidatus Woesebacteria bacterium RIFCSPHIGHO2_12_FULL_38_9]OGM62279.1 MAG: hypothetical protein A3A76_05345 [Candidatus Woesebacteria bacterium RIFCSPLOWO2_01_FULL_39_23]